VRTTRIDPIVRDATPVVEEELLDVGVNVFDPGFASMVTDEELFDPKLREAEARFMPVLLMDTLQRTGNWGVVRVIPNRQSEMDVWVEGKILSSDGEMLRLQIFVEDIAGNNWYQKDYEVTASKFSYDPGLLRQNDAFQGIYHQIANDMQAYAERLTSEQRRKLRTISELKFAGRFAPDVFGRRYLEKDENGILRVARLPADNDPLLGRIRRIRDRDYVFTDVLQDYYVGYFRQIQLPYNGWREETYRQIVDLREARARANAQIIGGTLALIGGLAAGLGGGSTGIQVAGAIGALASYPLISDGLKRKAKAQMHIDNIQELTNSFNADIEPHTIELENRIVSLTGTVDQQYAQWREILHEMWLEEIGSAPPDTTDKANGGPVSQ
jgi:hypothetical protein